VADTWSLAAERNSITVFGGPHMLQLLSFILSTVLQSENPVPDEKTNVSEPVPTQAAAVQQQQVSQYFEKVANDWKQIYAQTDLYARIHQERMCRALDWIDKLHLPVPNGALEVGCGAGLVTASLAQRGFKMEALDNSTNMIELTKRHLRELNLSDRVNVGAGDTHKLPYSSNRFALVVALGVIPWLHSPERAVAEMSRVLRPGGYLLLNADNAWRLNHVLDPFLNKAIRSIALRFIELWRRTGLVQRRIGAKLTKLHSRAQFDRILAANGFEKVRTCTLGFGPFTLFNRWTMLDHYGVRIHGRLQALADRGIWPFSVTGAQYLVLARKRP
jgi:ubiquinone/menaquinone biosynthesis C-methylase UbiE